MYQSDSVKFGKVVKKDGEKITIQGNDGKNTEYVLGEKPQQFAKNVASGDSVKFTTSGGLVNTLYIQSPYGGSSKGASYGRSTGNADKERRIQMMACLNTSTAILGHTIGKKSMSLEEAAEEVKKIAMDLYKFIEVNAL